ncbi:helix-hairpin-helix domain-containing protein [Brevibacterium otitidis]|uniref:Helix-hairpin-helix domain-containing protein n=1 Tax=Brevibacterium otitidis TaxID=53364 RepID=A0ABV5X3D0_9MICO
MAPSPDDRLADMLSRSKQHGWTPRRSSAAEHRRDPRGGAGLGFSAEEDESPDAELDASDDLDEDEDAEILALLPGNRPIPRRWILLAVLILTAAGIGGFMLLRGPGTDDRASRPLEAVDGAADPQAPHATDAAPVQVSADAEDVTAHVVGAVAEPGVVRLRPGARVVDAIDAAGGLSDDAEPAGVNLARTVEDGEQIVVPDRSSAAGAVGQAPAGPPGTDPGTGTAPGAGGQSGSGPGQQGPGQVNINQAGAPELETLPGVGPATAQAIITHRQEHGPFASVEDLVLVHGIGDATLARLREHITVG